MLKHFIKDAWYYLDTEHDMLPVRTPFIATETSTELITSEDILPHIRQQLRKYAKRSQWSICPVFEKGRKYKITNNTKFIVFHSNDMYEPDIDSTYHMYASQNSPYLISHSGRHYACILNCHYAPQSQQTDTSTSIKSPYLYDEGCWYYLHAVDMNLDKRIPFKATKSANILYIDEGYGRELVHAVKIASGSRGRWKECKVFKKNVIYDISNNRSFRYYDRSTLRRQKVTITCTVKAAYDSPYLVAADGQYRACMLDCHAKATKNEPSKSELLDMADSGDVCISSLRPNVCYTELNLNNVDCTGKHSAALGIIDASAQLSELLERRLLIPHSRFKDEYSHEFLDEPFRFDLDIDESKEIDLKYAEPKALKLK